MFSDFFIYSKVAFVIGIISMIVTVLLISCKDTYITYFDILMVIFSVSFISYAVRYRDIKEL